MAEPYPSAEDIGEVLGFEIRTPPLLPRPIRCEEERFFWFQHWTSCLAHPSLRPDPEHARKRQLLCTRFCVLYLPQLVNVVLDPPPPRNMAAMPDYKIKNVYEMMLSAVKENAYFVKYMLSTDPNAARGNELAPYFVDQLSRYAPDYDHEFRTDPTGTASGLKTTCEMVLQLLALQNGKPTAIPVPPAVKARLLPYLDRWARVMGPNVGTAMVAKLLRGEATLTARGGELRDKLEGLQKCAKPGCDRTTDLSMCGRCKCVLYCSPAHQQEHWRDPSLPHKALCFETNY